MKCPFVARPRLIFVTLVDTGATGADLDLAVHGAAQLVRAALRRGDWVGVIAVGDGLRWLGPDLGRRQYYRIADAVLDAAPELGHAGRRRICVVPGPAALGSVPSRWGAGQSRGGDLTYIKASFATLTEGQEAVEDTGKTWEELLDDLARKLAPLRATWTGEAADAFDRLRAEWAAGAAELREVLREAEERMGAIQGNYRETAHAASKLWQGGASAVAGGTIPMSAGAPGGSNGFEITVDDLRVAVRKLADLQLALVATIDRSNAALAATGGMIGEDCLLAGFREPYDRCAAAVCNAIGGVVTVLGAVSITLKDTANLYLDAEEASGGGQQERIPFPGTRSDYEMAPPPPCGGPGPEPYVPDILAGFWPNADPGPLWEAAEAWRALGRQFFDVNAESTRIFLSLADANQGETFSLIRSYWGRLCSGNNCLQDLPFDRTYLAVNNMAAACQMLGDAIATVKEGVANAVANAADKLEVFEWIAIAMDALLTRGASQMVIRVATLIWAGIDMSDFKDQYLSNLQQAIQQLPTRHVEQLTLFGDTHKETLVEGGRLKPVEDVVLGELRGKWSEVEGDHPHPDQIRVTPDRAFHILDGDQTGGGHRSGTGKPKKTEFPPDWNDAKVIAEIESVARNPDKIEPGRRPDRWETTARRDGVLIRVVVHNDGHVITAYPESGPGVVRNPPAGR
ncbi:WXG100 family type VII secretion target [Amycolatopsis anabasis]|uniref:WXG100 family type VII secretion target n=1 Tax=Amycolatopsis anabasis TaxID=1840409 RepID=UPI00131CEE74|nr:WXG100 family type VII secretion target [Amycolatopsis anabasis]